MVLFTLSNCFIRCLGFASFSFASPSTTHSQVGIFGWGKEAQRQWNIARGARDVGFLNRVGGTGSHSAILSGVLQRSGLVERRQTYTPLSCA